LLFPEKPFNLEQMRNRGLLIVVSLAALARFSLVFMAAQFSGEMHIFLPDSPSYVEPALSLMEEGSFATAGEAEIVRTPGYPLLLAVAEFLGGIESVIIPLQILFSLLTLLAVYGITLTLFKEKSIALSAAALYAIEPQAIYFSHVVLSETLFTALLLLGLFCFVRWQQSLRPGELFGAMALFCAAAYARPIGLFIPFILLGLAFWRQREQRRTLVAACLLCLCLIGAWNMRNNRVSGYSGFSAISAINLYAYQGAAIAAQNEGKPYAQMQQEFLQNAEQIEEKNKRYGWMRSEGLRLIGENFFSYCLMHIKGMARTLFDPGATDYLKFFGAYPARGGLLTYALDHGLMATLKHLLETKPGLFWSNVLCGLLLGLYYLLALLGFKETLGSNKTLCLLLVGLCFYFWILSGGPISLHRFRHPIMPLLCVFAGPTLAKISRHKPT